MFVQNKSLDIWSILQKKNHEIYIVENYVQYNEKYMQGFKEHCQNSTIVPF